MKFQKSLASIRVWARVVRVRKSLNLKMRRSVFSSLQALGGDMLQMGTTDDPVTLPDLDIVVSDLRDMANAVAPSRMYVTLLHYAYQLTNA